MPRHTKEQAIATNENETTTTTNSVETMSIPLAPMSPFKQGENIEIYLRRLEFWMRAAGVPETRRANTTLACMGEYAFSQIAGTDLDLEAIEYAELLDSLRTCFGSKKSKWHERFVFDSIKQKQGETINEFLSKCKEAAGKCQFKDVEERLIEKLINKTLDNRIVDSLLAEENLTWEKALKIALTIESRIKIKNDNANFINVSKAKAITKHDDRRVKCWRCGFENHLASNCKYSSYKCNSCNKIGHLSSMCKTQVEKNPKPYHKKKKASNANVVQINKMKALCSEGKAEIVTLSIGRHKQKFEIDSGAEISIMSKRLYNEKFNEIQLKHSSKTVKGIGQTTITVIGKIDVNYGEKIFEILVVDANVGIPLLGADALDKIFPNWRQTFQTKRTVNSKQVHKVECEIQEKLKEKYQSCFEKDTPKSIKGFSAHINLKSNASPVFRKAYNVPLAMKDKIENELKRLETLNVVEKVKFSDWASPIVPVLKKNGEVRICIDFKKTLNPNIEQDIYPLPLIDDIFIKIGQLNIFTILDLSNAYLQLELTKQSRKLVVANTHLGLYEYKRVPFGIKIGPSVFQRVIDQMLNGINNVCGYIDDIIIGGKTLEDCESNVNKVLQTLQNHNVKVNFEKSTFFQRSVNFLGHVIKNGEITPSETKLCAISNARRPKTITELRAYLGLLNYYRKFIPNMASKLKLMYDLLTKDKKFEWSNELEIEFNNSKKLITSSSVIAPFDISKQSIVSSDASSYGIGGVLCQMYGEVEKIVYCVSRTLTKTERNYPQIEKEALAIIFSVQKFHRFIYGSKFVLITDHKPLRSIFSITKAIPQYALNRLQHYALILQSYDYEIRYKKGREIVIADTLSRLPLDDQIEITDENDNINVKSLICTESKYDIKQISLKTTNDVVLKEIKQYILNGFPRKCNREYSAYEIRKYQLQVINNCIYWTNRLVIPAEIRVDVLKILHNEHIGSLRMKKLATKEVWWPKINQDIEEFIKNCETCMLFQNQKNVNDSISPWKTARSPFDRVHLDFFMKNAVTFLIIVDACSGWIHVIMVEETNAKKVINHIRELMAIFGLFKIIVADNGPPFQSSEFNRFCISNRIKLKLAPTYHPQSNGVAERAVQTVKKGLTKIMFDYAKSGFTLDLEKMIANLLFKYRNTPRGNDDRSPNDTILHFNVRTEVRLLKEDSDDDGQGTNVNCKYKIGDQVLVARPPQHQNDGNGKYEKATVIDVISKTIVKVQTRTRARNVHIGAVRSCEFKDGEML